MLDDPYEQWYRLELFQSLGPEARHDLSGSCPVGERRLALEPFGGVDPSEAGRPRRRLYRLTGEGADSARRVVDEHLQRLEGAGKRAGRFGLRPEGRTVPHERAASPLRNRRSCERPCQRNRDRGVLASSRLTKSRPGPSLDTRPSGRLRETVAAKAARALPRRVESRADRLCRAPARRASLALRLRRRVGSLCKAILEEEDLGRFPEPNPSPG